ncbi:MAG TPA: type II toxin-antitoxin system RelE/ParE family toxin [Bacteroidia bacterium]|jgi:toxin ParE1/3/4|nr:type II toxin-antitoxin system RelE/ParE family toxin [Bacteroidia bacterium]
MVEVNWANQAIEDINNIARFIAKDSEKYAIIQTNRFFERAKILESLPLSGKVVPEMNTRFIRELNIGNYRIIYLIVNKSRVDILTIHNGYRLLKNSPAFKR